MIRDRATMMAMAVAVAAATPLAACSTNATSVLVYVQGADSLPPVRVLRAGLTDALATRPCFDIVNPRGSGDAGVRPTPYVLPLYLNVIVDRSLSGPRRLAIDGYSGLGDDIGCATSGGQPRRTRPIVSGSAAVTVELGAKTQALEPVILLEGSCGDGIVDPPDETCDDGNRRAGDGCGPTCLIEPGDGGPSERAGDANDDGANGDGAFTDTAAD